MDISMSSPYAAVVLNHSVIHIDRRLGAAEAMLEQIMHENFVWEACDITVMYL